MADIFSLSDPPKPAPDTSGSGGLNLTPDEKRLFEQLFQLADSKNVGVVTGEVAPKFFERSGLPPIVLGEIWNIADTENRGFLTQFGFSIALRLIGQAQSGASPKQELALRPGPLPRFDGIPQTNTFQQPSLPLSQGSTGPRVPPLAQDKINSYASLFEKSGPQDGFLSGDAAKRIFEGAGLPNEVLGNIWSLSDREERGALNQTEFIVAMHLLVCHKNGLLPVLPSTLPRGVFDAAARTGGSEYTTGIPPPKPYNAVPSRFAPPQQITPQQSGSSSDWAISSAEKLRFDRVFDDLDKQKRGVITGEEAVPFFSKSQLSGNVLAQIWDLADINSEGHLDRDEFAVALHLITQQRSNPSARLPDRLPPNLIPPRLRQGSTFQPVQKTASAADDLFGLDTGPAAPQIPASTGGSTNYSKTFESDISKRTLSGTFDTSTQQSPSSSMFQPFKPKSDYGQSLMAQATGNSSASAARAMPTSMADLLGDNDPEISSKLDAEHTTELANLSNQVGNLSKQVQEVKSTRATTETEYSTALAQKQQFETRLGQMRSQYEQEAKSLQVLKERLAASRKDTASLQQQCATIEQSYQELQTQQRQVLEGLEADQRENRSLKEKMKIVNSAIAQLRPELEKLRSEARQQKGLVAINKKQLSTAEGERDKMQGETSQLQQSNSAPAERGLSGAATVTSPAPSTASHSTNPFHRKSPQASEDQGTPNNSAFESVFGPSVASPATTAPTTSFRSEQAKPVESHNGSVRSLDGDFPTPGSSPMVTQRTASPKVSEVPPPPAPERQITSSFLPFRNLNERTDSFSSSMKVVPSTNASNYGADESRSETPTNWISTAMAGQDEKRSGETLKSEPTRQASTSSAKLASVPGAFPESHSPLQATPTGGSALSETSKGSTRADPFHLAKDTKRSTGSSKEDFDAAFASLGQPKSKGSGDATSKFHQEFPPIAINEADDSDSSSEHGFDDDFNPATGQSPSSRPNTRGKEKADAPPGADAQTSPPRYDPGGVASPKDGKRDPNQFAAEYTGLLPPRDDPTEGPPHSVPSAQKSFTQLAPSRGAPSTAHTFSSSPPVSADTPLSTAPSDAYQPSLAFGSGKGLAAASTAPPPVSKGLFDDDFDKEFADLPAAKEADKGDEFEITSPRLREGADEFNPTFDSPSASKTSTMASSVTAAKPSAAQSKEWDDFFAEMGPPGTGAAESAPNGHHEATPEKPKGPVRGLSTGTEHDDPLLKRLTGMGYARSDALAALEKYNYNVDKAANYLTQQAK